MKICSQSTYTINKREKYRKKKIYPLIFDIAAVFALLNNDNWGLKTLETFELIESRPLRFF